MQEKKILIIYPYNFVKRQHGIDTRYWELAQYFKSRGFSIDLFSIKNFVSEWDEEEVKNSRLIDNLYLFDFKNCPELQEKKKGKTKRTLKEKITYRFKDGFISGVLTFISGRLDYIAKKNSKLPKVAATGKVIKELPDLAFGSMKMQLSQITSKTEYQFVLIGYVHWANLIFDANLHKAVKVIDVNDFITLQHFYLYEGKIMTGALLEEEINRINMFDKAMYISYDEQMFFSQFAPKPEAFFVPQSFTKRNLHPVNNYTYDILFIGSDNPHNQKSIKWFFESIYPLLDKNYRILIIGGITKFVDDYANISKIRFADNLDDIYQQSKIAICPMLQGTGMKIKVVEALSYNKPIVCTTRGVDGLNQKRENGCLIANSPSEFAFEISKLLSDERYYIQQRQLAEKFFENNLEESVVNQTLDTIFIRAQNNIDEIEIKPASSLLKPF